ncbi:MAG: TaqI-like C-terminal specificity domain-containing protein [Rikenellaceae bacterium]
MNRQTLQDIFRQPFNEQSWKELLINLFGAKEIRSTPVEIESDTNKQIKGYLFGELRSSDRYSIGLFAFEVGGHTNIELNRVGLRSLVKSYTRYEYDAALTVYYNEDQWRLSFICDLRGENTAPKRYTYVFGNKAESYRTAADRLIKLYDTNPTFEAIKDAFSVEQLSKDFFKEYKQQYSKFIAYIGDTKPNRDYVKKMLGRLVFLQFLQKKGWMGVTTSGDGWCGGDLQYLQNLVRKYEGNDRLLSDVLEVLFFDTLNTKRDGDVAVSVLGDSIKIPYLNGGLFDRDSIDNKDIDFPYAYFADLMKFFSHYNFTIDENDPYDAEVGIDPEMLGHIFENLLEDNKDKGAFYTPKEIVQYMCRQSLIEYLQSKLGKNTALESFVNKHDVSDKFIIENATEIENMLDSIKICDPAIGSGAFPMGILNEIFHCKMALDLTLNRAEVKKNIIQNSIYGVDIEQGAVDIARLRFWLSLVVEENEPQPLPNLDYKIMCGNSLLTTFDGEYIELNRSKGKNSIKIAQAKQRLSEMQREFYSLSGSDKKAMEAEINKTLLSIIEMQLNYELESSNAKIDTQADMFEEVKFDNRASLTAEYSKQRRSLNLLKSRITYSQTIEEVADIEIPFFDWEINFADVFSTESGGFDIVIGNPPYIQLQANGGALADMYKGAGFETFARTGDIYCLFYERGLQLLCDGGIETYITSNKWMRAGYGEKTRSYFTSYNPLKLIDLGAGVFDSATVDTNILVMQKSENKSELTAATTNDLSSLQLSPMSVNDSDIWTILSPIEQSIKHKIESIGTPLKDWDVEIYRGVLTGYNEAFIISTEKRNEILSACATDDERTRTESIIKPILRGRDIKRYSAQWAGLWLIFIPWHFPLHTDSSIQGSSKKAEIAFEKEYQTLYSYFLTCKTALSKRNKAETGIRYEWYALQRCAATYYDKFNEDKIIYREISAEMDAVYSVDNEIVNNKCYIITGESLKYLICILNSKVFNFYLNKQVSVTGGKGCDFFDNIPICRLDTDRQLSFIDLVDEILQAKRENPQADTSTIEAKIDIIVYSLYNLSREEIALIEIANG